jgi:DNA-binding NarL/FixJ family response regulator
MAFRKLGVSDRLELLVRAHTAGGLALWLYDGEPYVEPTISPASSSGEHFDTAAEKRAAALRQAQQQEQPAPRDRPAWQSRFLVEPTPHEIWVIEMILEDPDLDAATIARLCSSTAGGIQMCLSRIYNKAGVKTRAGLIAFLCRGDR